MRLPQSRGYELCESQYTMDNGYTFTTIQVCDMKDKELEQKINDSLNSRFDVLRDCWFGDTKTRAFEPVIHCQSSRYLSIQYIWDYLTADIKWHLCLTVDMQSGELIYLDDLIDMNEAFLQDVKEGKILKDVGRPSAILDYADPMERLNEYLAKQDTDYIFRAIFEDCTRGYLYGDYWRKQGYPMDDMTNVYHKYFFLEEGMVYLIDDNSYSGINEESAMVRIAVEDVEGYLKVPAW